MTSKFGQVSSRWFHQDKDGVLCLNNKCMPEGLRSLVFVCLNYSHQVMMSQPLEQGENVLSLKSNGFATRKYST